MSRENVEVVHRVYDAASRRDTETVLSLYDAEVELDFSRIPHAEVLGGGIYRGHDGLRSWYREWYEAWESFEQSYEELIDVGEQVISVWLQRGRGRASGAEVELGGAAVWTVRDGKVVRQVGFPNCTIEVEELRDLGDVTLTRFVARGHSAASGTRLIDSRWRPSPPSARVSDSYRFRATPR